MIQIVMSYVSYIVRLCCCGTVWALVNFGCGLQEPFRTCPLQQVSLQYQVLTSCMLTGLQNC